MMSLPLTACRHLVWRAVGNPAAIAELLASIVSIGKKRGAGHGHVLSWDITAQRADDEWKFAHLHPHGGMGRTTPPDCLDDRDSVHPGGDGQMWRRPPDMHPARRMKVMLPVRARAINNQETKRRSPSNRHLAEGVVQAVKDGVARGSRGSRGGVAVYDICRSRRVRLFTGGDLVNGPRSTATHVGSWRTSVSVSVSVSTSTSISEEDGTCLRVHRDESAASLCEIV
ncbi:hypothetical protein R1X32_00815 (plasmid) [Rhodococcus opacus]|uniref:hypothetical protein n=1 Tax=Rhodococcus opacus TaxID=37919 RepID=UPI0034D1D6B4